MKEMMPPSRVESAAGKQDLQSSLRALADVPDRYRNYPDFMKLTIDPAHENKPIPKTIREAMSAVEADLSGIIKGPVTRSDSPYIDFFDANGHPYDVKTPLSPTAREKWEFDYVTNAETILKQLDKDHPNKKTGENAPVAVLLDTTYMTPEDHQNLWRELRRQTKEDRSILKRIYEVNVQLDDRQPQRSATAAQETVKNQVVKKRLEKRR